MKKRNIVFLLIFLILISFFFVQKLYKKKSKIDEKTILVNDVKEDDLSYSSNIINNVNYMSKGIKGNAYNINALKGEIDLGFIGQNDVVYSCELLQAFPTSMGQIELADANTDGVVELNVQLSYKNWRSSKQKGKPFGLNQSGLVGAVGNFIGGAIAPKMDLAGSVGKNFNFKQDEITQVEGYSVWENKALKQLIKDLTETK